ncbi:hypothetical protein [Lonsdalea britannica]|uniref:hypothetical protein n=1 Tax=Lonsdalea britannica TaxID=1082704 RepID=UPI00111C57D0|nr:hypothetical protein [Lonsdalea britannica]
MKRFYILLILFFFSSSGFASKELEINGVPLTLSLKDNTQVQVSSCADFISLRKSGNIIESLPDLSDPDYNEAKNALFLCWPNNYVNINDMRPVNYSLTLHTVIQHFPATAGYIVSEEELNKVKLDFKNKTIFEYLPDLKIKNGRAISLINSVSYLLVDSYRFKNAKNQEIKIVALSGHSIGGTASSRHFWRIDDESKHVWKVTELDENSPF